MVDGRTQATAGLRPKSVAHSSAVAAIREFFNLSPLWLKGAVAFASLLFCLSAVLAVGYLQERQRIVVNPATDQIFSSQELDAAVMHVQRQADEMLNQQPAKSSTVAVAQEPSPNRLTNAPMPGPRYASTRNLQKPLTRQERQELAADLGLAYHDDDDLDLVGDNINQAP